MLTYFHLGSLITIVITQCACAPSANEAQTLLQMLKNQNSDVDSADFAPAYPSSPLLSSSSSSSSFLSSFPSSSEDNEPVWVSVDDVQPESNEIWAESPSSQNNFRGETGIDSGVDMEDKTFGENAVDRFPLELLRPVSLGMSLNRWQKRGVSSRRHADKRWAPHRGYHASRGKRFIPGLESLWLAKYFQDAQKYKRQPHLGFHGSRG